MTTRIQPVGVRLAEVMAALSLATDAGMGQPMEQALRTCVLAVRLGEAAGLGEAELTDTYYLALLRHVGCTAEAHVAADVFGDELAARGWIAFVDYSQPPAMIAALLRNLAAVRDALLWPADYLDSLRIHIQSLLIHGAAPDPDTNIPQCPYDRFVGDHFAPTSSRPEKPHQLTATKILAELQADRA